MMLLSSQLSAATGVDTVKNSKSAAIIIEKLSNAQNLDNKDLNELVDQLFELDNIPDGLIEEVKDIIAILKKKNISQLKTMTSAFPADDIYTSFEIHNLFPKNDMLKLKPDSSIHLTLQGMKEGDYFHPYNGVVTSAFGWRDSAMHNGIDIDLRKGDKVAAAFDGMVRVAKSCGGFGNVVIIRHYNGLETVYAHLSRIKVKSGQVVLAGQTIGLGGSTGHSTGSHLHFEVRLKGLPINPQYLISFTEQKLVCTEITVKKTKWGLAAFPTNAKVYKVEKGDTVLNIAKHFATTTSSLKEINGLPNKTRLKVGQVIAIR
jgi:murein DD-endopeptidase MepM/ murein hydrolase activator NlpD